MKREIINRLEVILKVTERCNINCSYCYYFNGTNTDYEDQPAHLSTGTAEAIALYLNNAIIAHSISEIQIDLHGGEPLLIKKSHMRAILGILRGKISSSIDLRICVQTNATLLDDEWISIFAEHDVSVGVSLDGPPAENDVYRIDKKGQGTHARVAAAIQKLNNANKQHNGIFSGIICVVNPSFDGRKIYRHFVDDLQVKRIHFLNQNHTRDSASATTADAAARFLLGALEEWIRDADLTVHVRQFTEPLKRLCAGAVPTIPPPRYVAMTIRANGNVAIDDDLRNTLPPLFKLDLNVKSSTLTDFLNHAAVASFHRLSCEVPSVCSQCGAKEVCRAGSGLGESVLHRYSFVKKFNNASLFCSSHKAIIIRLGQFALSHGISWSIIERNMAKMSTRSIQIP